MRPDLVHYLPIGTTLLSAVFLVVLVRAALIRKSGPHLWWWAAGILFYGIGTGLESTVTLFGNTVALTKAWYIAGALLGGYPLAQGAAYLHLDRRKADLATWLTVPFIAVVAILVLISPANLANLNPVKPTGDVLAWTWVRAFTPVINLYAFAFLVGGAIFSAVKFAKTKTHPERVVGNVLIAVGGILPGIGGTLAKTGLVEALYIGEFVGLILIWSGYGVIATKNRKIQESQVNLKTTPQKTS